MDHESAKDYYSASLQSAITYFYAVAGSNAGWKPVAPSPARSTSTSTAKDGMIGPLNGGSINSSSSGGSDPALAMAALSSNVQIAKRSYPGKSAELVRATALLPGTYDERTDLEDWRCMFESAGVRREWDDMIESCTILEKVGKSTFITRTIFKTSWRSSPRDLVLIETTLRNENTVLHIATSLPHSKDLPKYLRPTNPYVRARLDLAAYCVQIIPNENSLDDVDSIPFSTSSSQQGHSLRVAFYYQLDFKGWAANSSTSMTTHVPQCITGVHASLLRNGPPPHLSRHGNRIQIENDEYDADSGMYDLLYSVLEEKEEEKDDSSASRSNGYSAMRKRQQDAVADDNNNATMAATATAIATAPGPIALSSVSPPHSSVNLTVSSPGNDPPEPASPPSRVQTDEISRHTSVDVEIDEERWAAGSDVRITVLVNDRADEAYARGCVDCFRYMDSPRFVVRLRHPSTAPNPSSVSFASSKSGGREEELVSIRVKIDRVPRAVVEGETEADASEGKVALVVNGVQRLTEEYPMFEDPEQEFMGDEYDEEIEEEEEMAEREEEAKEGEERKRREEGGKVNGNGVRTGKKKENLASKDNASVKSTQTTSTTSSASSNTRPPPALIPITPKSTDPAPVRAAHATFLTLLHEPASSWKLVQQSGALTLSRMEVPDHVMGVLKGEGVYEGWNVWDVRAAVEGMEARRVWDGMFDDGVLLEQLTPWCILWYTKLKGFWPTSPRDVVAINTTYATQNTVQIFTTSTADASLSRSFPGPEATGYVRAQVDIAGWHLESPLPTSVHITYLVQSDPKGWIPAYVLTTMATQAPAVLGNMIEFLEKHGAPPNLIDLYNGRVNSVLYDHEKGSWRLEYVPYTEGPFARNPPEPPAVEKKVDDPAAAAVAAEGKGKGKASIKDNGSTKESSPKNSQGSSSPLSSTVLMAEIRLDARKWSGNGDYEVVVDPPPSRVTVIKGRAIDPFGLWMRITHEQEGVSPLGGKVLVMVRRSSVSGWGVAVNGIQTPVVEEEWVPAPPVATRQALKVEEDGKKPKKLTAELVRAKTKDSAKVKLRDSEKIEIGSNESLFLPKLSVPTAARLAKEEPAITPNTPIDVVLRKLGTPPVQQALSALALLRRLDDQQYGWTFVSDKAGLQVSKRVVPPDIPEYLSLVKAVKVIERFSLEEVAAVVTNSGCRRAWDDMLDDREVLKYLGNGCAVIKSGLKAWFPLKSRDLFTASCTARASADSSTNSQSSRFFYVETSINDYPHLVPPTDPTAKPRGRLYLSGWILEAVDPYTTTTNHPIPSTRVTFMASLDMGGSIPGTVSSLVTLGMPKAIQQVETYLKSNGAPPYLTLPPQLIELKDSDLADDSEGPAPAQRFEDVYYELPRASSGVGYRNVINSKFNRHAREFKVGLEFDLKPMCVLDGEMSGVSTTAGPSSVGGARDAREVRMLTPSTSTSTKTKPISTLIMERRGSAPGRISTDDLPDRDGSKAIKSNGTVDGAGDDQDGKVMLEIIVDLKRYPQGYEILTEVSPLELNGSIDVVSSLSSSFTSTSTSTSSSSLSKRPSLSTRALSVKVVNIPPAKSHTSSLSPSSSQFKHSIHVSAHPSVLRRLVRHRQASLQTVPEMEFHPLKGERSRHSSMDLAGNGACADVVEEQDGERFVLDFLLLPLQEREKPSKLTKKGVLGDEKDEWNGVVVVNGEEVQVEAAKGLSEKELAAQREKSNNAEDHGGVVAKARRRNTLESNPESPSKSKSQRPSVASYPSLSWLTGSRADLSREPDPDQVVVAGKSSDQSHDLDMEFVREPTPLLTDELDGDWTDVTPKDGSSPKVSDTRSNTVADRRATSTTATPAGQVQEQLPEGQYPFVYLAILTMFCLVLGMVLRAWLIAPYCRASCSVAASTARLVLDGTRKYQQASFREMVVFRGFGGWDYVLVAVRRQDGM